MDDENLGRDLFGDLTTLPSGRRGRPAHRWTSSNADRVIIGLAMGYSDQQLADGLGISIPTLRKYYFSELKRRDMQRTRFELWRAEVLARDAGAGNVGAMRELGKVMEKRDRHLAAEKIKAAQQSEPQKLGKKEERQKRATAIIEGSDLLKPGYNLN